VPEEPDVELNRGVVSDRVLLAYAKASERLRDIGIPHVLVGGLAVGAWGHPRATKDVDFLVREKDAFEGSTILTFKRGVPIEVDGVTIDYLTLESLKIKSRERMQGPVVPIELLFVMKLKAKRIQDDADIVALIKRGADVPKVERWLSKHALATERSRLLRLVRRAQAEE
jgi:hypothetical protein